MAPPDGLRGSENCAPATRAPIPSSGRRWDGSTRYSPAGQLSTNLGVLIELPILERRIRPAAVGRGTRVRVLDADGPDRQQSIADLDMQAVTPRHLVWADVVAPPQDELDDVAEKFGLPVETVRWLALMAGRAARLGPSR